LVERPLGYVELDFVRVRLADEEGRGDEEGERQEEEPEQAHGHVEDGPLREADVDVLVEERPGRAARDDVIRVEDDAVRLDEPAAAPDVAAVHEDLGLPRPRDDAEGRAAARRGEGERESDRGRAAKARPRGEGGDHSAGSPGKGVAADGGK